MEINMNKKPILIVLTGGTIQSSANQQIIDIDLSRGHYLIDRYKKEYKNNCIFEVAQPIFMLSENLSLTYWNQLISYLKTISFEKYQGIIITHGSDTLAYTSCMVGLLLGHINIPIMLTASNYVLDDPRSNGLCNFAACVSFIQHHQNHPDLSQGGVFCIYQKNNGVIPVYIATHILPADCIQDEFSDCSHIPFATMTPNPDTNTNANTNANTNTNANSNANTNSTNRSILDTADFILTTHKFLQPVSEQSKQISETIWNNIDPNVDFLHKNICMLTAYPGFSYQYMHDLFRTATPPAAILHLLYHSGTLCNTKTPEDCFETFAKTCDEHHLPIYLCSQKKNTNQYASIAGLNQTLQNLHPLYQISAVSAYCKLLIAYNQTCYRPTDYMQQEIYHETIHMATDFE